MKPSKLTVFQLFEAQRRYIVPLFQRPYVWAEEDHWEPLWQDILRKSSDALAGEIGRPHFLGAVVLNQLHTQALQISASEIIDGQQRLCTLQLFLAAFRDVVRSSSQPRLLTQLEHLTRNETLSDDSTEDYKVWPTHADQQVFTEVMSLESLQDLEERFPRKANGNAKQRPRIVEGYLFFHDRITEYCTNEEGNIAVERLLSLLTALQHLLQLVVIDLEHSDDPQIIFETLNARGVPLLPSDLIRNFVLQQARDRGESMEHLYESWWQDFDTEPAEDAKGEDDYFWKRLQRQGRLNRPRLDLFFHHFIQFQRQRDTNITQLFQEFRDWWERGSYPRVEEGLREIRQYAGAFARFLVPTGNDRTSVFLRRLLILDTSTLYPLLLKILGPDRRDMSDELIEGILVDLESYIIRRMICRLPAKNYNNFFTSLLQEVNRKGVSRGVVRERLLSSVEDTGRWPDNHEFEKAWVDNQVYGWIRRDRVNMVLEAIESALYTSLQEKSGIDQPVTIEHIMPREWLQHWPLPAEPNAVVDQTGETVEARRNRLIHTFGNLTLLTQPLNSSVSNGPYEQKRRKIMQESTLRLNGYLHDRESWDEDAILNRGRHLFRNASALWPHPGFPNVSA